MIDNEIHKYRLLYCDEECSLSYKKGKLIYRTQETKQWVSIGSIINQISLLERLSRKEPRCAAKIDDDHFVVSFEGNIINYCVSKNSVIVEHHFSKGMNNPLDFLSVSNGQKNEIYYGEYIWNEDRGPVAIYKRSNDKWETVYTFPQKTITHIHNIIEDKYRNGFIILTGDHDSESGLWFADKDFYHVEPILRGSQQYRACVAFPDKDGIYYATDTPLENNYIYYLKLNSDFTPAHLQKIYDMPGPCIYGCELGGNMYFSTSVEPDSNLKRWRFRFTYKLGAGVKSRFTHIIKRTPTGQIEDIYKIKKDILPMWLFQFGNALFPKNNTSQLFIVLQSTVKGHGVTLAIDR